MGYFRCTSINCAHHQSEWEDVVRQVQGPDWRREYSGYQHPLPQQMSHHLEAKALYVFTMARRLVSSVYRLAKAEREKAERAGCTLVDGAEWKLIFVETTSLLFPMIELVGHARSGIGGSNKSLWAGIYWLHNPKVLRQVPTPPRADTTKVCALLGLEVGHLIALRHYYLHGSKNLDCRRISIADIISYKLPQAIAKQAEKVMPVYWDQLKQDDGTPGWVERLARADIRPFKIQGSKFFEAGLVDPDIVDYLEGSIDIFGWQVSQI